MFCIESIIYLFKTSYFFTFYNLQNLVCNTFHSLDSRVTVFLVNIMKSNDRNLIFVADLFTDSLITSLSSEFKMKYTSTLG